MNNEKIKAIDEEILKLNKSITTIDKEILKLQQKKKSVIKEMAPNFLKSEIKEYNLLFLTNHGFNIKLDLKYKNVKITSINVDISFYIEDSVFYIEAYSRELGRITEEISQIPEAKKKQKELQLRLDFFVKKCYKKYGEDFEDFLCNFRTIYE